MGAAGIDVAAHASFGSGVEKVAQRAGFVGGSADNFGAVAAEVVAVPAQIAWVTAETFEAFVPFGVVGSRVFEHCHD